jgi:hypothetical protein
MKLFMLPPEAAASSKFPDVTNLPAPVMVPAITDTSVAVKVTARLSTNFPESDKDLVADGAEIVRLPLSVTVVHETFKLATSVGLYTVKEP